MKTNLDYDMYIPTRVMFGVGTLNILFEGKWPKMPYLCRAAVK